MRIDLETLIRRLAPDGDSEYRHILEGEDDMSAHMRCVLTQTELTIPISNGRSGLGIWQGVFLWEHRIGSFERTLTVTLTGD